MISSPGFTARHQKQPPAPNIALRISTSRFSLSSLDTLPDPTAALIFRSPSFKKHGSVTICASQPGDRRWYPAKDVFQTLTANPFVAMIFQGDALTGDEMQIENSGDLDHMRNSPLI